MDHCTGGTLLDILFETLHDSFPHYHITNDHVLMCREVSGETDLLPGVTGAMGGHSAWLQGLRSPLIKEVVQLVTNEDNIF